MQCKKKFFENTSSLFYNSGVAFRWKLNTDSVFAFAVVVSKHARCSSVIRHKIKRRIRHCFFLIFPYVTVPINVVCVIKNQGVMSLSFPDLYALFEEFVRQIRNINAELFT
ncbi:ribonuclease P protein component [Holospora obtusa]|nr:ribonuclease P protein component [Holospora obtusa]